MVSLLPTPRKVPTARLVPVITPDEAAELTYYGSEVIHPFTMEQVIRARIPIRIKNVENPRGEGTIIYPDEKFPRGASSESTEGNSTVEYEVSKNDLRVETKVPTAVTIKDNIIVLNIHSNRKTISHGFLARIFGTLDRAGVVVDLISTSEVHVSMAMQDISSKKRLDRLHKDLEKIGDITVSKDMAILSLVGKNMRHAVGCAGMMFTALAKAGINIEMISQGASEINISCGKSSHPFCSAQILTISHREQRLCQRPQCHSRILSQYPYLPYTVYRHAAVNLASTSPFCPHTSTTIIHTFIALQQRLYTLHLAS
jgi:aspartate kinase